MSRTILNGAAIGVLAASLAACALTPTYPTGSEPAATRLTTRPLAATPTPAPKPTPAPPPEAPLAAPGPAPVQSTTLSELPPAAAAPEAQTPSPSPETSPAPEPPPLDVAPPPPAYRTEPARYAVEGKVTHPKGMYRDYEVKRHDHVDAIARALQVSPTELIRANHLKDADHLRPGQHLRIPVAKAYVARSGDSMTEIARRFSVSVDELASINDLSRRARLSTGEEIALPGDYHDRGPVKVEPERTMPLYARRESPRDEASPRGGIYTPSPYAIAAGRAAQAQASGGGAYAYVPPPAMSPPPAESPGPDQAAIIALARGRFIWPLQGSVLSKFGATGVGERNDGIDIAAPEGTVVRAAAAGNVVYAGDQIPGFGDLVLLQHADGWVTAYAHLKRISVQMRQNVSQGEEIGQVGETGGVSQPQLHFEIRFKASAGDKAKPIDPMLALPASAGGSER